jgi:predicted enzyme related to lactoylglutathione lyase
VFEVLAASRIEAVVPVSDLRTALPFYRDVLGLELVELVGEPGAEREARFAAAEGSLTVYESEAAGISTATLAAFLVDDLDSVIARLRGRGAAPIDYDLPHLQDRGRSRHDWPHPRGLVR